MNSSQVEKPLREDPEEQQRQLKRLGSFVDLGLLKLEVFEKIEENITRNSRKFQLPPPLPETSICEDAGRPKQSSVMLPKLSFFGNKGIRKKLAEQEGAPTTDSFMKRVFSTVSLRSSRKKNIIIEGKLKMIVKKKKTYDVIDVNAKLFETKLELKGKKNKSFKLDENWFVSKIENKRTTWKLPTSMKFSREGESDIEFEELEAVDLKHAFVVSHMTNKDTVKVFLGCKNTLELEIWIENIEKVLGSFALLAEHRDISRQV